MKFKRIVTFGDSWTAGVGSNLYAEKRPFEKYDRDTAKIIENKIRNKYSFGNQLSKKIGIDFVNKGQTAASNSKIIETILKFHEHELDNIKDDLFIITWSSGLRNDLSFIPDRIKSLSVIGYSFGYKELIKQINNKSESYQSYFKIHNKTNDFYNDHIQPFFQKFINGVILNDIIDNDYFDFMNQMQIYFLQQYLNHFGVKYIMCDAFESMFSYGNGKPKEFIDMDYYLQPKGETNFYDFIDKNYGEKYFENWDIEKKYIDGGYHPNRFGYDLIANELKLFIDEKIR